MGREQRRNALPFIRNLRHVFFFFRNEKNSVLTYVCYVVSLCPYISAASIALKASNVGAGDLNLTWKYNRTRIKSTYVEENVFIVTILFLPTWKGSEKHTVSRSNPI